MKDGESPARPGNRNLPLLIFILSLLLLFIPVANRLARRSNATRPVCKDNLSLIGRAINTYSLNYREHFPFDERGPLYSLALLYPEYVEDPKAFACPSARKKRCKRKLVAAFPLDTPLAGAPCTYGYTWRVDRLARSNFAIVADMPWNHSETEGSLVGFNVLYVDGAVRWVQNPHCSCDPADNIFAPEPGWSADTDAWIRQR